MYRIMDDKGNSSTNQEDCSKCSVCKKPFKKLLVHLARSKLCKRKYPSNEFEELKQKSVQRNKSKDKEYVSKNHGSEKERQRKYYLKNKEKIKENYQLNKEQRKQYYQDNRKKIKIDKCSSTSQ